MTKEEFYRVLTEWILNATNQPISGAQVREKNRRSSHDVREQVDSKENLNDLWVRLLTRANSHNRSCRYQQPTSVGQLREKRRRLLDDKRNHLQRNSMDENENLQHLWIRLMERHTKAGYMTCLPSSED